MQVGHKSTVFIQLNEINFDVVRHYADLGYDLSALVKIHDNRFITVENEEYNNLEPWIQWFTTYCGKPYSQHKIFRLGEGHNSTEKTLFSALKSAGLCIGAVAPMNLSRETAKFDFFLPDPWSKQRPLGDIWLRFVSDAVRQAVNDNSGKGISKINKVKLLFGLARHLNLFDFTELLKFYQTIKGRSFRKALFLDMVLVKLHQSLHNKYKVDFSSVFLNAGAHIQHHYFLNSSFSHNLTAVRNPQWYMSSDTDPLLESLIFYDAIIKEYESKDYQVILATGLQQQPYLKETYYYRLADHKRFLSTIGISNVIVNPRMTRDFEVVTQLAIDCDLAIEKLRKITDESKKLVFGQIEKTSSTTLFCTLTYDQEIREDQLFYFEGNSFKLHDFVNFVAVKNGMHDKFGTLYFSDPEYWQIEDCIVELQDVNKMIVDYAISKRSLKK